MATSVTNSASTRYLHELGQYQVRRTTVHHKGGFSMAVYFKIIIDRNRGVCLHVTFFKVCTRVINFQTAMCMLLSPFFNIFILNSSSVHGYCGEPVTIFYLHFSSIDPYIFAR